MDVRVPLGALPHRIANPFSRSLRGDREDHCRRELPGADVVVTSVNCGEFAVAFVAESLDPSPDLAQVALALTSLVLEQSELRIAVDRFGLAQGVA